MSYRTHRFFYGHALRESGTFQALTPGSDAATPSTRLYDDLHDRVWKASATGSATINVDTATGLASRAPIERLAIPASHNVATIGSHIQINSSPDDAVYTPIDLSTGEVVWVVPAKGEPLVLDVDPLDARYLAASFAAGSAAVELGEIEWLRMWQPATGEVPSWEHPAADDNVEIARTQSGETYFSVLGRSTRRFEVEHHGVGVSDALGYDELFRQVGQREAFWYDHSDSGDWRDVIAATDAVAAWSQVTATLTQATGPDGNASAIQLVNTAANVGVAVRVLGSLVDVRDSVFSLDLRFDAISEVAAADDILVQMIDDHGGTTRFNLGGALAVSGLDTTWFRVYFAPETISTLHFGQPVDLSRVQQVSVHFDPSSAGSATMRFANLIAWRRRSQPRRVRFTEPPRREQTSRAPASSGPLYRIRLSMEEVLG